MKRSLMNVLSAGVLSACAMFAQGMHAHNGGTPPDPAAMIANQVDHLTTLLTLTAAQQTQATAIFSAAATSETAVRTNLRTAHSSLATAIKAGDTASIDNLASQIGSFTGQEVDIQSKAQAAFYKSLTADQKTKFDTLHGQGGFGGPGGAGGFRRGAPRQ